jgi:WD40 repeat protein
MKNLFSALALLFFALPTFAQEQSHNNSQLEIEDENWAVNNLVLSLELREGITRAIGFSANNHQLAALYEDSTIRIWDTIDGTLLNHFYLPIDYADGEVAFSPNGQMIAVSTGYLGEAVYVLDAHNGHILRNFTLLSSYDVAFTADDQSLIVADWGGLYVWDLQTGEKIFDKQYRMGSVRFKLSVQGDMLAVALAGVNMPLIIYDTETWTGLAGFGFFTVGSAMSVAINSENTLLASGHCNSISLWDISTDAQLGTLDEYSEPVVEFLNSDSEHCVQELEFFADDTILIGDDYRFIQFWDVSNHVLLDSKEGQSFAVAPNGQQIAIISSNKIQIWTYSLS